MKQSDKDLTAAIVDGVLKFVATGGFITTALVIPNAVQALDKPLAALMNKLDKRSQEREFRRTLHYMKRKELISYNTRDYEHGIKLTRKGRKRLKNKIFKSLSVNRPDKWDHKWRLVFFDIPIEHNNARGALTYKLDNLGFKLPQKSIWVHPFPCRHEIEAVAEYYGVRKYVSYVEITQIDHEEKLKKKFKQVFSKSVNN